MKIGVRRSICIGWDTVCVLLDSLHSSCILGRRDCSRGAPHLQSCDTITMWGGMIVFLIMQKGWGEDERARVSPATVDSLIIHNVSVRGTRMHFIWVGKGGGKELLGTGACWTLLLLVL